MAVRRALTVRVSDQARDELRTFCVEHGVSQGAVFEVLCSWLSELRGTRRDELLREARKLDGQRRFPT
jgi:hypothetical protein